MILVALWQATQPVLTPAARGFWDFNIGHVATIAAFLLAAYATHIRMGVRQDGFQKWIEEHEEDVRTRTSDYNRQQQAISAVLTQLQTNSARLTAMVDQLEGRLERVEKHEDAKLLHRQTGASASG